MKLAYFFYFLISTYCNYPCFNHLQNDPLAYLKRAGVQWDRRVRKSLNAMCSELKMACQGQPRISTDRDELLSKWDELSNYTIGEAKFPLCLYKDIFRKF